MVDFRTRRTEYDVTNRVQVSDPSSVSDAVQGIFSALYPHKSLKPLHIAFADFARMYRGEDPRYHGCETHYHDMQHSLDVTLSLARHIDGFERSERPSNRLGPKRAAVGIVTALYHDVGYLRRIRDRRHEHGAEYTLQHVSRGGSFLGGYLNRLGLGSDARIASQMIHYTGYERDINRIHLGDDRYTRLGHLLGTADLSTQMADRCYLEKCRDRLYEEFVKGGVAERKMPDGKTFVLYSSPRDLMQKTPGFFQKTLADRLDGVFQGAHQYVAKHFGGQSLYMESVRNNIAHLQRIIRENEWSLLRRKPPLFTAEAMRCDAAPVPHRAGRLAHAHGA